MILVAGVLGAPIFALLGGIAMFAFFIDGSRPDRSADQGLRRADVAGGEPRGDSALHAHRIPPRGGQSSTRLLRALRALFGWVPGGTAIAAATLCAFFTLFTGGSGVTILALGGLLLPALIKEGYRERFSIGLLTASGSLGLLFPLSVPLILYGIVAQNVADRGSVHRRHRCPALLMLGLLAALGVREAIASKAARRRSASAKPGAALWEAKWEMLLPVVVLLGAARRLRDDVGVGGDRGALRAHRAAVHPPRPAVVQRRRARRRRVRGAGRRRACDPRPSPSA